MRQIVDSEGKLNYGALVEWYPWIIETGRKCILSPDSDGLLCGLLMQHFLDWDIVGFYDGKVLVLKEGLKTSDCVFLDMEIFRSFTKSIGQHMLMWNAKKDIEKPEWANFDNCISPNNIRKFDGKTKFSKKYPLGTIHMLLGIVNTVKYVDIKKEAICPLLYTDGTFKNMFNYPENVLDWLSFLSAEDKSSPLYQVFFDNSYSTSALMLALKEFFAKIQEISGGSRGGDKIQISNKEGHSINMIQNSRNLFDLNERQVEIGTRFLNLLSELTGWGYLPDKWCFCDFIVYNFSKGQIVPNGRNFDALISQQPISWAMTAGNRIEYTIESTDKLD